MPIDEQQLSLVQHGMTAGQNAAKVRFQGLPDLRPALRRRPAERVRVLVAQNGQERVVVDLNEFFSPIQHDRQSRGEHRSDGGVEFGRPFRACAEWGVRPFHAVEQTAIEPGSASEVPAQASAGT